MQKKKLYFGSPEKLERRNSLFKSLCTIGAVLVGYYIFVRLTGLSVPCLFHVFTGLKCPGCGITHMFMHTAKFELHEAFLSNPLLFVMLIPSALLLAVKLLFMPDWLENDSKVFKAGEFIALIAVVVFGVVRNILGI